MDVVTFIIDVVKFVGTPTYKYIYSYRKLEKNMKTLRDTLEDLNSKRRGLANQLKGELTIFKIEKDEVVIWKERVESMNKDIERIGEEVKKRSYVSRARLGKRVEEKIVEANELLKRGEGFSTLVMDRPPATGLILPTEELVGRASIVDRIWVKLIGGEVGVVGVEDVLKFQKEIANDLLGYHGKKDNQDPLPEERDRRAGKVTQMLEASEGTVVIILDDVRKAFSLTDVGVSDPIAQGKCKLVMASPSEEVCKSTGCQVVEVLGPLSKDDAVALFLKRSELAHLMAVSVIARIMEEVVAECGGFPPRILSLGSEMKGVNDVRQWKKKLKQKRKPLKGEGEGEEALNAFMKKYDMDGDGRLSKYELRKAFKDMGLHNPTWKAVRALRHADTNNDGFIDNDELNGLTKYASRSFLQSIW